MLFCRDRLAGAPVPMLAVSVEVGRAPPCQFDGVARLPSVAPVKSTGAALAGPLWMPAIRIARTVGRSNNRLLHTDDGGALALKHDMDDSLARHCVCRKRQANDSPAAYKARELLVY